MINANFVSNLSYSLDNTENSINASFEKTNNVCCIFEKSADLIIQTEKICINKDISDINEPVMNNSDKIINILAGETIIKEKPVIYNPINKKVYLANAEDITHFRKYLGISLNNADNNNPVSILIYGLYSSENFNFSLDKEIYIGNRNIVQDLSGGNYVFQHQIGNVLTENTIFLNYLDPFKL